MAKTKYRYDPETLSYEEVEVDAKQRWLFAALFLVLVLIFTTVATLFLNNILPSTSEVAQAQRIEALQGQVAKMSEHVHTMEEVLADLEYRDDNIYRVIFEAEPVDESLRHGGIGGVNRYKNLDDFEDGELLVSTWRRLDSLSVQMYQQSRSYDAIINMAKQKEEMLAHTPAIQPLANENMHIASGFGYRIHPIYKTQKLHTGLDFSAPTGTEIYATGDGVISLAGNRGNGYGNYVIVDHGFNYETLYGHMSEVLVKEGEEVKRGQLIGLVGSTGTSVAPHLHYEVHKKGTPIDPVNFFYNDLTPAEFEEMIRIAAHANQSFD